MAFWAMEAFFLLPIWTHPTFIILFSTPQEIRNLKVILDLSSNFCGAYVLGDPPNPPSLFISTAMVQNFILSDFMDIMPSLLILLTPVLAYMVHLLQYCWRELKKKRGVKNPIIWTPQL